MNVLISLSDKHVALVGNIATATKTLDISWATIEDPAGSPAASPTWQMPEYQANKAPAEVEGAFGFVLPDRSAIVACATHCNKLVIGSDAWVQMENQPLLPRCVIMEFSFSA